MSIKQDLWFREKPYRWVIASLTFACADACVEIVAESTYLR
jgi:hypothetical protein